MWKSDTPPPSMTLTDPTPKTATVVAELDSAPRGTPNQNLVAHLRRVPK